MFCSLKKTATLTFFQTNSGLRNKILTVCCLFVVWKSGLTSAVHKGTLKHLPFPPSLTNLKMPLSKVPLSKVLNPPLLQCICSVVNSTRLWLYWADPRWRCLCINDSNEQQHHRNHSQLQAVKELLNCTYCKKNGYSLSSHFLLMLRAILPSVWLMGSCVLMHTCISCIFSHRGLYIQYDKSSEFYFYSSMPQICLKCFAVCTAYTTLYPLTLDSLTVHTCSIKGAVWHFEKHTYLLSWS